MIDFPSFKLPARQTVVGAVLLGVFSVLALIGLGSLLYGFWLFWRPATFLVGGLIFFAIGCLGMLGRSGAKQDEPW